LLKTSNGQKWLEDSTAVQFCAWHIGVDRFLTYFLQEPLISTIEPQDKVSYAKPTPDCLAFSVKGAVQYANDYAEFNERLPNIYLCSYPEYTSPTAFTNMRPFFGKAKGRGVEVGTFEGYNAANVIKYCNVDKLYCIDPYQPYEDVVECLGSFSPKAWDAIYLKVKERIGDRAEIIRKPSLVAVNSFNDNSLDFVYLDGDHSRENVSKEILAWFPKVKVGGLLGGHDCKENGVLGAITEWNYNNPEYDNKIATQSNDWWIIKND
jgi:hypothetical protein